jgi:predicted DNA-binding protein YlxM (UPF0122 family)
METRGQEFLKMHQGGLSFGKIAAAANTTRSAVAGYIYRQKNPDYLEKARAYGREKRKREGQARKESRLALVRLANPTTPRDRKMLALYAKGMPLTEIGRHFDISGQAIRDRMRIICGWENYERLHARSFLNND